MPSPHVRVRRGVDHEPLHKFTATANRRSHVARPRPPRLAQVPEQSTWHSAPAVPAEHRRRQRGGGSPAPWYSRCYRAPGSTDESFSPPRPARREWSFAYSCLHNIAYMPARESDRGVSCSADEHLLLHLISTQRR